MINMTATYGLFKTNAHLHVLGEVYVGESQDIAESKMLSAFRKSKETEDLIVYNAKTRKVVAAVFTAASAKIRDEIEGWDPRPEEYAGPRILIRNLP